MRGPELLAAFAAAPGGVGARELRVARPAAEVAAYNPRTCQPSEGERS